MVATLQGPRTEMVPRPPSRERLPVTMSQLPGFGVKQFPFPDDTDPDVGIQLSALILAVKCGEVKFVSIKIDGKAGGLDTMVMPGAMIDFLARSGGACE